MKLNCTVTQTEPEILLEERKKTVIYYGLLELEHKKSTEVVQNDDICVL